jgi:hypothetical protein
MPTRRCELPPAWLNLQRRPNMGSVRIPLHSRKHPDLFAIVDEEDYERVSQHRWGVEKGKNTFYALSRRKYETAGQNLRMHRLVVECPPDMLIDHRNGNGLDNQKQNLRICTNTQNMQNQRKQHRGSNTYKGAYWEPGRRRWRASIAVNGKTMHLGHYATEEEAARAYDRKAIELFGDFARINFSFQGELF